MQLLYVQLPAAENGRAHRVKYCSQWELESAILHAMCAFHSGFSVTSEATSPSETAYDADDDEPLPVTS